MRSVVRPGSQAEQVGRLVLAVLVVIMLPALPLGTYLIYPFVILTTWFHEMGHGLTAILMGQEFERLLIYSNGSGLAQSAVADDISPLKRAAISAGGPLAPAFFGSALILVSAHPKLWRPTLWFMVVAILASVILYVRSVTGYAVLPLVAAGLALIAWRAPPGMMRFTLQFLGVLGAMSMVSDFNYLLTESAVIDGREILSDTGQMEAQLGLPHWFWAGLILVINAAMVIGSLRYALNEKRLRGLPQKLPANVLQFKRRD